MTKHFRIFTVLSTLLCCFTAAAISHAASGKKAGSATKPGSDKKSNVTKQDEFVSLFNGKDLDNWVIRGGKAPYTIEEGVIVGTARPNTPNTFLCTKRDYADFVLELELKIDNELNSGVQIRSHCHEKSTQIEFKNLKGKTISRKMRANVVYGYQVEVDPSKRAYSGGIYDESRRGWIDDLSGDENKAAREAFKVGEWNHYRIEAIGDSIKTWVNDVPAADLTDDADASGFIGLQVHGVRSKDQVGKQVRWRNVRIKEITK